MEDLVIQAKAIRKDFNRLMESQGYTVHTHWNCAKRFTNGYHLVMLRNWNEKSDGKAYFQIISGVAYDAFTILYQDLLDIPLKNWNEQCCVGLHNIGSLHNKPVKGITPWELSEENSELASQIFLEMKSGILELLKNFDEITDIKGHFHKLQNMANMEGLKINLRSLIDYLILAYELNYHNDINYARELVNQKILFKSEDFSFLNIALKRLDEKYIN